MFFKNIKFIGLCLAWLISLAYAQEEYCDLTSPNELLQSIKQSHPEIVHNKKDLEVFQSEIEVAKEVPNPQMNLQAQDGEEIDGETRKISLNVLHTFELGGKPSSRKEVAKSYGKRARFKIRDSDEGFIISAIKSAYRLKQVMALIPLYEEAIKSFQEIFKSKEKQKNLSPKEEVEKHNLSFAINDFRLKLVHLKSEQTNLNKHIAYYIHQRCQIPKVALPEKINLDERFSEKVEAYSKYKEAKEALHLAKLNLELEKSNIYPDLKIGPSFQYQEIAGRSFQTYGVAVQMELPFLNTNKGRRVKGLKTIESAHEKFEHVKHESKLDLETWVLKYKALSKALKSMQNQKEISQNHKKMESLFKRGVIPISLVVDSHKQTIDYVQTKFRYELDIVDSLWNIYKINGVLYSKKF